MPSGDAQRVWFPEMLSLISEQWNDDLSWNEISVLCTEMTEYRKKLKNIKNIKPIMAFCENCKKYHEMDISPIGVRSLLFALKKSKIIDELKFKTLESEWRKYQRKNKLDGYGNPK